MYLGSQVDFWRSKIFFFTKRWKVDAKYLKDPKIRFSLSEKNKFKKK